MSRPITPRALVSLLLGAACGLGQAEALLPEAKGMPAGTEPVLELQLADGSVVRVPSDATDKRSGDPELADRSNASRRIVPRPRVQFFDPHRPGAIASVRG